MVAMSVAGAVAGVDRGCGIDWFGDAVVYHIYPLGMLGCGRFNDAGAAVCHRLPELEGIVGHLAELGVGAVYFGPLFESDSHGYDTRDYFHIDRRLGDDDDFRHLVQTYHDAGIRVIVDGVFNHVGRGFWGFREAMRDRDMARTRGWFSGLRFDAPTPDGVAYDTWEGHGGLVKLNLSNPDVRAHLLDAVSWWVYEFGIDGIRLDAADCLDLDFIRALREHTDKMGRGIALFGEVIHGDYRKWAGAGMLHGTTNYEVYKGMWSSCNDGNFHEIAYSLRRQFGHGGIYKDLSMYSFVDNHDVDRLASRLSDVRSLYTVYSMMFTTPGTPSIYYGSEWGMEGRKANGFDADVPIRPAISVCDLACGNVGGGLVAAQLFASISRLSALRRSHSALCHGDYTELGVGPRFLAFAREYYGERLICVVSDSHSCCMERIRFGCDGTYTDILNGGTVECRGGIADVETYPHWVRVFVK